MKKFTNFITEKLYIDKNIKLSPLDFNEKYKVDDTCLRIRQNTENNYVLIDVVKLTKVNVETDDFNFVYLTHYGDPSKTSSLYLSDKDLKFKKYNNICTIRGNINQGDLLIWAYISHDKCLNILEKVKQEKELDVYKLLAKNPTIPSHPIPVKKVPVVGKYALQYGMYEHFEPIENRDIDNLIDKIKNG